MPRNEPPGCLAALFPWLFGSTESATPTFPYKQNDSFLTPAEASFYRVLHQATGEAYVICPKVNLADLFFVPRPHENRAALNRIDRKHVDFVLCDPQTLRPVLAVELDDASHRRGKGPEQDAFKDRVFEAAGLRLVRVRAQNAYDLGALRALIGYPAAGPAAPVGSPQSPSVFLGNVPAADEVTAPICPKCDIAMVQRTATRGAKAGQTFFGCPNYPKCRQTA